LTVRKGAGDVSAAQRSVLYKVDDAHQAGFVVGEDLSLTDTQRSRNAAELAARQAQAQALAADIRSRAAQLLAADSEVGAKLTATAGDVGSLNFNEKPVAHDGKIQLVDWKQAPAPTPSPGHTGQDVPNAIKTFRGVPRTTFSKFAANTIVGIRKSEKHGPTIDIRSPNKDYAKIHVNSDRGGVPEIPVRTAGPPEGAVPEQHAPVEPRQWKARLWSRSHRAPHQPRQSRVFRWGLPA
ncbi:MAG TPA: hypothetical protein VH084_09340, partial [Mycobacterium sp.]|nr:hypothetical protein [Mycobacterium sp.]